MSYEPNWTENNHQIIPNNCPNLVLIEAWKQHEYELIEHPIVGWQVSTAIGGEREGSFDQWPITPLNVQENNNESVCAIWNKTTDRVEARDHEDFGEAGFFCTLHEFKLNIALKFGWEIPRWTQEEFKAGLCANFEVDTVKWKWRTV